MLLLIITVEKARYDRIKQNVDAFGVLCYTKCKMEMYIMKTIDLFCGCGGLSLGFQKCGYEIVGAFDYWDAAIECYSNNFDHQAQKLDLSKKNISLSVIRPLNPEIIIGGPPCQDFSSAGGRQEGERANLTISFAKIIKSIKPKYFVMENVSRAQKSKAYTEAISIFEAAGYGLTEKVLDASKCGVPQKRKRLFCIGALNERANFLDAYLLNHQSIISMTVREYFNANNYGLDFDYYYRHPRTYSRRAIYSVDEPSPTVRGVNRPRPANYKQHKNDAEFNDNISALTYQQRALIQTFPADFNFGNNQALAEQMIGNAVPVNLASYVANALNEFVQREKTISVDFPRWLITNHNFTDLAVKDTISRLNRCNKILRIEKENIKSYINELEVNEWFKSLSVCVRSQIKRALTLYDEYRNQLKTE